MILSGGQHKKKVENHNLPLKLPTPNLKPAFINSQDLKS